MKICQHGAEIFNKMCSFEVSIGLLPLISIFLATEPLLYNITLCSGMQVLWCLQKDNGQTETC